MIGRDMTYPFFPHEANAASDPRCMLLIDQLKMEGYGIFWRLVEELRTQEGFKAPLNLIPVWARTFNTSSALIEAVIKSYGLFEVTDDGFFFYSKSLNEKMEYMEELREKRRLAGIKSGEKRRAKALGYKGLNKCSTSDEHISNKNEQTKQNKTKQNQTKQQDGVFNFLDKKLNPPLPPLSPKGEETFAEAKVVEVEEEEKKIMEDKGPSAEEIKTNVKALVQYLEGLDVRTDAIEAICGVYASGTCGCSVGEAIALLEAKKRLNPGVSIDVGSFILGMISEKKENITENDEKTEDMRVDRIEDITPPNDGVERNFDGMRNRLLKLRVGLREFKGICAMSRYGMIGHPVWDAMKIVEQKLRDKPGCIVNAGLYILGILNKERDGGQGKEKN